MIQVLLLWTVCRRELQVQDVCMYTFINTVYTHAVCYDNMTVCVPLSDSICLFNQGLFHVIGVSTCEVSVGIQSHLQVHRPVTLPHFEGLKHFPTSNSPFKMTAPGLCCGQALKQCVLLDLFGH